MELLNLYNRANLQKYLAPFWNTRTVYDESLMIVGDSGASQLIYKPKGPVTVRNNTLEITYKEGVDYHVSGRTIERIPGGSLPFFREDEYYMDDPGDSPVVLRCTSRPGKNLFFSEGGVITKRMIFVSYETEQAWEGFRPSSGKNVFTPLLERFRKDGKGSVLFYGDSLTCGCNSSSYVGLPPYVPSWPELITMGLEDYCGAGLTYVNEAVGGWASSHAVDNWDAKVKRHLPYTDLFVLAFGMNDGWIPAEEYRAKTELMINRYFEAKPDGYILLVAPMTPNRETDWVANQSVCEKVMLSLQTDRIAAVPVYSVFMNLVDTYGKLTRNWLANNINHVNDFGARVYAQAALTVLGAYD